MKCTMPSQHIIYHNLKEAMTGEECFICSLTEKAVRNYYESFLYEHVNDIDLRDNLNETLGYCNNHAWVLGDMGNPLANALIYHDFFAIALSGFKEYLGTEGKKKGILGGLGVKGSIRKLFDAITGKKECPACEYTRDTENRYMTTFGENILKNTEFTDVFVQHSNLCLTHLAGILKIVGTKEKEFLVKTMDNKYSILLADLKELIRKNDYRFYNEPLGKEKDMWLKAMKLFVGLRGNKTLSELEHLK